jgi:hypothetical protein
MIRSSTVRSGQIRVSSSQAKSSQVKSSQPSKTTGKRIDQTWMTVSTQMATPHQYWSVVLAATCPDMLISLLTRDDSPRTDLP